ncbi:hypothetical protein MA16_Dca002774 [Dendrobium catenatum]|uniref:Uncharacterized protein n=1 Tax=Dendrobium catenatum TaxID=906689 RepID=A0A2I0X8P3_9ASPA|nr:hypothetical protein MA16_Dca002774 [Dendrobium catenatum]
MSAAMNYFFAADHKGIAADSNCRKKSKKCWPVRKKCGCEEERPLFSCSLVF